MLKQNHLSRNFTFMKAIETGTAAGVGHAKGVHLQAGDQVEASIEGIGTLRNSMV